MSFCGRLHTAECLRPRPPRRPRLTSRPRTFSEGARRVLRQRVSLRSSLPVRHGDPVTRSVFPFPLSDVPMVLPSTGLPRRPCRAPGSTLPPPGASPLFSCASVSPQADRGERAGGWRGGGCSVPTVTRGRSAQSVRAGASFTRFSSPPGLTPVPPAPAGRAGRRGRVPAGASPAELLVPRPSRPRRHRRCP